MPNCTFIQPYASDMLSATRAAEPPFQLDQPDSTAAIHELLTDAHAEALVGLLDEPVNARLQIYAYFLGSDEERTDALLASTTQIPEALYPICLVLRYLVLKEHTRLGESSRRFNWSLKQIHAAVASAYHAHSIHSALAADPKMTTLPSHLAYPDALSVEPTTRDIHLQSSVQLTLLAAWQLAQSLLLCPIPFSAPPSALVLGSLFHTIAQTPDPATREGITAASTPIESAMLDWILHDTEQLLAIDVEALRKAKRERKKEEKKQQVAVAEAEKKKAAAAAKQTTARSGFSLLSLDNDDPVEDDDSDEE